ncbi:MAG: transcription elongation factor GreA-like protein [Saprospiraceae bacterium]
MTEEEEILFKKDFEFYLDRGRFVVHNTIAGGIIFLREPEIINGIKIEFNSELNAAFVAVEYASEKRNARNLKTPQIFKFI